MKLKLIYIRLTLASFGSPEPLLAHYYRSFNQIQGDKMSTIVNVF